MQPPPSLKDRFRGTLLGALVGDCMGAYWERESWLGTHPIKEVKAKIRDQVERALSKKTPPLRYTDDTALTFAMAESLVEYKKYNETAMAIKFTETFFAEPNRGYGASVGTVFSRLWEDQFKNAYGPARKQFEGQGSYGNGSCMRTSPGALLGYKDEEVFFEVCEGTAQITHTHPSAINGARLQALAVKLALDSKAPLKPVHFVDTLLEKMAPFESDDSENAPEIGGLPSYKSQLIQIRSFLCANPRPSTDVVQCTLGHGIMAVEAAPCALYAFLHCCGKSFEELVPYAISLGGDTDTIASMAGAIGGAFWGKMGIPEDWIKSCEGSKHAQDLGDQLFDIVAKEQMESSEHAQSQGDQQADIVAKKQMKSSKHAQSQGDQQADIVAKKQMSSV